jgi:hypothetical protein
MKNNKGKTRNGPVTPGFFPDKTSAIVWLKRKKRPSTGDEQIASGRWMLSVEGQV